MAWIYLISTFLLMEPATWLIHKYIMHGLLWNLHRDHHDHGTEGHLEKNDWFFVIFAIPAMFLIMYGTWKGFSTHFFVGIGITLYGMAYFLVHDIFIHQRFKFLSQTQNPYLLSIRRAHKQHHKHLEKENGECFGFLYPPVKYLKMYMKRK